jgi:hypothetical protein
MPAERTMYAFRLDDLCYAALFPTKIELTPDLEYVPVKLEITLEEAE